MSMYDMGASCNCITPGRYASYLLFVSCRASYQDFHLHKGTASKSDGSVAGTAATFALIPSAPSRHAPLMPQPPGLIPSQPPSHPTPSASSPFGLIPSQPVNPAPAPSGLIPSAPTPMKPTPIISSEVPVLPTSGTNGLVPPPRVSMASTEEGLRPWPTTTAVGNPDGHHEITEPNLTATASCRGCSPVIEISVSGIFDWPSNSPAAEHAGSSALPPTRATVTAGQSQLIITKEPTGSGFVIGGSTTVKPGQTVTVDNTPIVIQTSSGATEVVVGGTQTIPMEPSSPESAGSQITEAPILAPVTIGSETVSANANSQYVIQGQTLQPGGPAITVDGTTVSLLPSASAIVVNGQTSTLSHAFGAIITTTAAPLLTLNNNIYTANRAGFYVLAPGTTLVPGGPPATISGTVISIDPHGTAAIIQGTTSFMLPMTTVVTMTRATGGGGVASTSGGGGGGGGGAGGGGGGNFAAQTSHSSLGVSERVGPTFAADGWLASLWLLGVMWIGCLAIVL
ncbi:hypothetical protein EJ04DRAFT_547978 [Polyplosphaeria fusca]|uniref:Uncharacterized protein n=1 Tax=Polyplosphaeria fusca TaxID=682080 RepID=A0A9P4R8J6_9PLEO|nr:hypothetical protein EJ04DRAFT_547978 [Polyplosphaeria fusca]